MEWNNIGLIDVLTLPISIMFIYTFFYNLKRTTPMTEIIVKLETLSQRLQHLFWSSLVVALMLYIASDRKITWQLLETVEICRRRNRCVSGYGVSWWLMFASMTLLALLYNFRVWKHLLTGQKAGAKTSLTP